MIDLSMKLFDKAIGKYRTIIGVMTSIFQYRHIVAVPLHFLKSMQNILYGQFILLNNLFNRASIPELDIKIIDPKQIQRDKTTISHLVPTP